MEEHISQSKQCWFLSSWYKIRKDHNFVSNFSLFHICVIYPNCPPFKLVSVLRNQMPENGMEKWSSFETELGAIIYGGNFIQTRKEFCFRDVNFGNMGWVKGQLSYPCLPYSHKLCKFMFMQLLHCRLDCTSDNLRKSTCFFLILLNLRCIYYIGIWGHTWDIK